MTHDESIATLSEALVNELIDAGRSVSIAESCTGGWIAKALTDTRGSSQCFAYGVVSYSNGAKESLLGVNPASLIRHGAVSAEVVKEMAVGVLNLSGADYAIAVSGIAGPDGGTDDKPVGTVWFGWAVRANRKPALDAEMHFIEGDRETVRARSVVLALQGIRERLRKHG
ncbi:MAG: CinA family protein [Woeseiaceae bacterium]|nr:CinA family protein [Woeseiaceae bacterium]